jgi:diketogulonate reductase-like aldo/keto reductase
VTGYSPLGASAFAKSTSLLDDPVINEIATKHGRSPA